MPSTAEFEEGDIRNKADLERVFSKHKPDAVFVRSLLLWWLDLLFNKHFCAWIEVGESCADPLKYFDNNVSGEFKQDIADT